MTRLIWFGSRRSSDISSPACLHVSFHEIMENKPSHTLVHFLPTVVKYDTKIGVA